MGADLFPVERGIPLPQRSRRASGNLFGRTAMYPWSEMKVGDSFLIPGCTAEQRNSVGAAAAHQRRLYETRFAMRMLEEGLRVWRIE